MNHIILQADGEQLSAVNSPAIFSGDRNTVGVTFAFSEEWQGYAKTAVFYVDRKDVYSVLLDEEGSGIVPHEVMEKKGSFYIGVVGSRDDEILTSSVLKYRVGLGAVSDDAKPSDPTPDIYEQILGQYSTVVRVAIEEHAQKLQEAQNATAECYNAISALQAEWVDYNGGYPNTSENADDMNGGYPQSN